MLPNPQFPADLVRFAEKIHNGKLHVLYCMGNLFMGTFKGGYLPLLIGVVSFFAP